MSIRSVRTSLDLLALLWLDTTSTADRVYRLQVTPRSFARVEALVQPPLHKAFTRTDELDDDRLWEQGFVAQDGDELVGFAAVRTETWDRRAAICHLYVAP